MKLPTHRVAVKICGITRHEDALRAVDAGADALGFNTWRGTPRFIDVERAGDWIAALPILKIGLLVNATYDETVRLASLPFIDALQLHGDESMEQCAAAARLGKPLIKAIRAGDEVSLANASHFFTPHILLDAAKPGAYGGTGTRVGVDEAVAFQARHPTLALWLAGGLGAENVRAAIQAVRPVAVDVASGVESAPGIKDFAKMREFILQAHSAC